MSQGEMCINKRTAGLWRLFKASFSYILFQIAFSGGAMGDIKKRQSWHNKKDSHFYSISFLPFAFSFIFFFLEGKTSTRISSWCSINQVDKVQDKYLCQTSVYEGVAWRNKHHAAFSLERGTLWDKHSSSSLVKDKNTFLSLFPPSP